MTFSSLTVSWSSPLKETQNGIIQNYTVYYREQSQSATNKSYSRFYVLNRQANITGLSPFTKYTITVSASTSVGEGPQSEEVAYQTAEAGQCSASM